MTTKTMMRGRGGGLQTRTVGLLNNQMPACEFFERDDQLVMPPGFRFHPFDEELIVHYLNKKAAGETLPFGLEDVIPTVRPFYGPDGEGDPRCLFQCLPKAARHHPLVQRADEFYIFTHWTHCNAGDRPTRVVGPGTWNFNHDRAVVDGRGRTIGRVAHLTFLLRDNDAGGGMKRGKGATTHWVMHEYHLTDEQDQGDAEHRGRRRGTKKGRRAAPQHHQQQPCEGRLVLCRIRYTQKDKDNVGGVVDIDEGHINNGGPLVRPRKRRGVERLALEEAAEEETTVVEELPQHPVAAFCSTPLDPPPPPDHRLVRAAVEMCTTILDDDDVMPPAPAAPPAMPLYEEAPREQLLCPPAPVAVDPAGRWPIGPADAQRDRRGTRTPHALLPHYAGVGEAHDAPQFVTPPAPVVDVWEPRVFDPPTSRGGECGLCTGDNDYMEQDLEGNWMIHLGDFLPGNNPNGGEAARIEMCDTRHVDRHTMMPLPITAPPTAAPIYARDPPCMQVASPPQPAVLVDEDVHELPQVDIDVDHEPPGDLSLEYWWPPSESPDRPPDELMIPLQGVGGFPSKDLEAALWHNLCWSP